MVLDNFVVDLALILVVAGVVTILFKKLKQPLVLGYIVAGFLISPNFKFLPTVVDQADITVWADIGVIFLMFGLGLEFSFKKIATVGGSAFTIALTVMCFMILVGAGVGSLMGWGKMDCIFLGGMLSMSSTMIILKSYEEYNLKKEPFAQLILGTLVIEDIAGIFMLIILSTMSVGHNVSGVQLISELGIMLIYLVAWLLIGIFIIPSLFRKISGAVNDEMIVIIAVALCLLMVVIANQIGFSSALGAFLAGSILAGTVIGVRIEHLIKPIKDLFGSIFFVSVGMLIVPEMLLDYIVPIIILCIVVIFGQILSSTFGIIFSGQSLHTAIRGGFSMMQIGEFSFIVATLGMSLGEISDFLYPIIVCVSVITAFITPVSIKNSERVYRFVDRKLPSKIKRVIRRNTSASQSSRDKDADWNEYIKKIVIRTLLCSLAMFMLYWVGTRYLTPVIADVVDSKLASNCITAAIIIILMAPFANFMHGTNNALQVKLWVKHKSNRLPLITLKAVRILIAACFMALVLRKIFHIPFVLLVLAAAIPIVFMVRSEYLNGVTINMEKHFAANFSERILAKEKKERGISSDYHWLDESLYVIEFKIIAPDFEKTILEIADRREFVVTIIRIIRGDQYINMPSANEVVRTGDVLQMLGTWDEVDACTIWLEDNEAIEYTETEDMILKDYIYGQRFKGMNVTDELLCVPILLDAGSKYIRTSIKNSDFRSQYRANVIGIERGNLPIVSPDIETIMMKGDIIWLMGGYEMVDKLIRGGLMDK
ncbi:MAG: cation:proton antiporter [Bacillota bacterium]|nr:cation:proton antiporter [Bacillota bacterium]